MKEFNKKEYNKLCAELIGYVNTTPTDKDFNIHEHPKSGEMIETNFDKRFIEDWNWIMEVVNKIKPIVTMSKTRPLKDYNTDFRYALISAKKEVIVQAIWEFLNWHKENKK